MTPVWHVDGGQLLQWMLAGSLWLALAIASPLIFLRALAPTVFHRYQHLAARTALSAFLVSIPLLLVLLNVASEPRLVLNDPAADRTWLAWMVYRYESWYSSVRSVAVFGWLLGAMGALTKLGRDYLSVSRVFRSARLIPAESLLGAHGTEIYQCLRRRDIRILQSDQIAQPCAGGMWRSFILLPAEIDKQLTTSELSAIVAHEIAHIDRGDVIKNMGLRVVQAVFWFNPGFCFVVRAYEQGRELACDRAAVAYGVSPAAMARALAKVSILAPTHGYELSALGGGGSVVRRIKTLVQPRAIEPWRRLQQGLVLATVVLCSGLGVAGAQVVAEVWGRFQARADYLTQTNHLDLDVLTYDVCSLLRQSEVFDVGDYGQIGEPVSLTFKNSVVMMNGARLPANVQRAVADVLDKHSVKRRDENFLRFYQSDSELGVHADTMTYGERIGTGHWLRTSDNAVRRSRRFR